LAITNYTGEVDPTYLLPKFGESYKENKKLKPIVDLANQWKFGDMNKALNVLRNDTIIDEETLLLSYMLETEMLIIGNNFKEAREQLKVYLKYAPKDLQALFLGALVAKQLENEREMMQYIDKLQDISPELTEILKELIGFVDEYRGRVDLEELIPENVVFDAIVLYGNRMEEDGSMSKALASRLEKTLILLEKFPEAKLLASGGAALTPYSESEAMLNWLTEHGIDEDRIYMDEVAKDTVGNIFGYERLLEKHNLQFDNYCCVTSLSHLARAWMGFVQGLKRNEIPFERVYAAAPEAPNSIEVPKEELVFTLFTVVRSAEWLERRKFIEFENTL
jgi:tetratricopeptide (TPR) repeat protein